jgi:hypothetical protein
MKRFDWLFAALVGLALPVTTSGCTDEIGEGNGEDLDGDGKADGNTPTVSNDNLNGLWDGTFDGKPIDDVVIRSWDSEGIQVEIDGKSIEFARKANKLTATVDSGSNATLAIDPNDVGQRDDAITGTIDGKRIELVRDVGLKDTIELQLPKDRPYRMFLHDMLMPAAHRDRESYVLMDAAKIKAFMESTVLFQAGSFQRKYMKGANRAEQTKNFLAMIDELDGIETTPRSIISDVRFTSAVKARLKDDSLTGLALVNFNLYFTTGAGRSLTMPITDDAMAFFITDRPSRAEKLGLVVMDTPAHGPLASTFGRQLLDMAEMPAADTHNYAQAMMDLLVKSDPTSANALSGPGKSALVDWFAVMAIEDYRNVAFGLNLGWGHNMTNVQFFGLVARALAPGAKDSAGNPVIGQVIVGDELRPGDPSYADVLNGGNDMRELTDMARLKKLVTRWLRQAHPAVVAEVEAAYEGIVPAVEELRAQSDVFHLITAQHYDSKNRQAKLTGAAADRAVRAVVALVDVMVSDSAALEAFILTQGIRKSNEPAPKSTGF